MEESYKFSFLYPMFSSCCKYEDLVIIFHAWLLPTNSEIQDSVLSESQN